MRLNTGQQAVLLARLNDLRTVHHTLRLIGAVSPDIAEVTSEQVQALGRAIADLTVVFEQAGDDGG